MSIKTTETILHKGKKTFIFFIPISFSTKNGKKTTYHLSSKLGHKQKMSSKKTYFWITLQVCEVKIKT